MLLQSTLLLACIPLALSHGHFAGVAGKGSDADPHDGGNDFVPTDCRGCSDDKYDKDVDSAFPSGDNDYGNYTTDKVRCDNRDKESPKMTISAGETIGMMWNLVIGHPGPAAMYMSFDGDKTWVLLSQAVDPFIDPIKGQKDMWDSGQPVSSCLTLPFFFFFCFRPFPS